MRLDFPSQREAPKDLLRTIHQIEPKAVLLWLERGSWVLGTMVPHSERIATAGNSLRDLLKAGKVLNECGSRRIFNAAIRQYRNKLAMAKLKYQGFVHQQTFAVRDQNLPGLVELWLREAVWIRQHEYEAMWREMESPQELTNQSSRIADLTDRARLKEAWRMEFKRPTSVLSPGIPTYDSVGVQSTARAAS